MSNLIYSLISFIIAIFFIFVGVVCVIIPWSPDVRTALIQFILEDSTAISVFGLAVVVIGLAIVANILLNSRRRYYYVKSSDKAVAVDQAVIQQYLQIYWKRLFPNCDIPCRLTLKNNKIHISADLPYLPISEQRNLLERIKDDLTALFVKSLGYRDEFFLNATFQSTPKEAKIKSTAKANGSS